MYCQEKIAASEVSHNGVFFVEKEEKEISLKVFQLPSCMIHLYSTTTTTTTTTYNSRESLSSEAEA